MSSNIESSNKKLKYLGAGVAAVGIAGATYYLLKKSKGSTEKTDEEDTFASAFPVKSKKEETLNATATQPAPISQVVKDSSEPSPDDLLDAALMESVGSKAAAPAVTGGTPDANGLCQYPNLGIVLPLVPGWGADDDISPMPTVAIIQMKNDEYGDLQPQAPGDVPVALISVEDVSADDLTCDEFRQRNKQMALTQMLMVTKGMFPPEVEFDDEFKWGHFTHKLEYKQTTPYYSMKVLNLIAVQDGLAYIFQLMGNPTVFGKVKDDVLKMAKEMVINPRVSCEHFTAESYTMVESKKAKCSIKFPSAWEIPVSNFSKDAIFEAITPSTAKSERISVYSGTLEELNADAVLGKGAKLVSQDDQFAMYSVTGGKKIKVLTNSKMTLVVKPEMVETCVTSNVTLIDVLTSITESESDADTYTHVNKKQSYSFKINKGSKVMESRLGERTLLYAPLGVPKTQEQMAAQEEESPILTIRTGDPSNDPDCRPTLGEWYDRIKSESQIENLKKDKDALGRECVTFITKEMQQTQPGYNEERTAKVIVYIKDGTTYMLRWETPTEHFRKQQRELEKILASFEAGI